MDESTIPLDAPAPGDPLDLDAGAVVGRYTVVEKLGAGGMGVVYAAHDPDLDRRVAVKLVRPGRGGSMAPTEGRARLIREAQAMATVSHPNVVAVFDVGTVEDLVFIAMEFIDGETLSSWLRGDRTTREILDVFGQAGAGLAAAHRADLVHRDFKPANVLVGADGRVRVLDFGLAAAPGETRSIDPSASGSSGPTSGRLTQTGVVMGTPAYMAPEQHLGRPPDAGADQFSFCVALYRALYDQFPYEGETSDEVAQHKTLGHIRAPPRARRVPRRVHAALTRGLSPDPEARFGTMEALLARLSSRRRGQWALAAIILTGGVVAALASTTSAPAPRCDDGEQLAEAALGSEARVPLQTALEAVGSPYARESRTRIEQALGDYATGWASTHRKVCLEGDGNLAVLDARRSCLRRDLGQVKAVLATFGTADKTTLGHAVTAALNLPDPSRCATLDPRDDVVAQAGLSAADREAFESAIADHLAAVAAGNYDEAVTLAREALAIAERTGAPGVAAKARLHLGGALSRTGDYEGARKELEAAFFRARELSNDPMAEAAATALVLVVGDRLVALDEAEQWVRHARTHLERSGTPREREAAFLTNLGVYQSESGHPAEAKKTHERALVILLELHGEEHTRVATVLSDIAGADEDLGNYEEARRGYEKSLAIMERTLGPGHPELVMPLNNLGLLFEFTGKNEEALAMHQRALQLTQSTLGPKHPRVPKSLHNIGNVMRQMGKLDEAVRYYEESLPLLVESLGPQHPSVAMVHNNLGAVAIMRRDTELGLSHNRKALEIRLATLGPDHQSTGMSYGNLGNLYYARGEFEQSAEAFGHAARIFRKALGERHPIVGAALADQGMSLHQLGRYAEAIELLEASLELPDVPMEGPTSHAMARFVLANALWDSGGDRKRAIALVREAEANFAERGAPVADKLAEAQKWLAERP